MDTNFDFKEDGICCFCGKKYHHYGNDIRPLVSARGNRCCDECNSGIVIPNRLVFWRPITYRYFIKDKETGKLIDASGLPFDEENGDISDLVSFTNYIDAEHHINIDHLFHHEVVRVALLEDKYNGRS